MGRGISLVAAEDAPIGAYCCNGSGCIMVMLFCTCLVFIGVVSEESFSSLIACYASSLSLLFLTSGVIKEGNKACLELERAICVEPAAEAVDDATVIILLELR